MRNAGLDAGPNSRDALSHIRDKEERPWISRFLRHLSGLGCLIALVGALAVPATAQQTASTQPAGASGEGAKLYVFTSGSLGGFPKAALQIGATGNIDWAPVSFYVIKHPKGNVMFDTGNNDKTITDPDGWWGPLPRASASR